MIVAGQSFRILRRVGTLRDALRHTGGVNCNQEYEQGSQNFHSWLLLQPGVGWRKLVHKFNERF